MQFAAKLVCLLIICVAAPAAVIGQTSREISKTLPVAADGSVSIDTFKGSLSVTAWDSPQVEILARIEPDGVSPSDAEKVQNTDVRIDQTSAGVRIKSDYDKVNQ